jgi:hypothetical protein
MMIYAHGWVENILFRVGLRLDGFFFPSSLGEKSACANDQRV